MEGRAPKQEMLPHWESTSCLKLLLIVLSKLSANNTELSGAFDGVTRRGRGLEHVNVGPSGHVTTTPLSIPTEIRGKCLVDLVSPAVKYSELEVGEVGVGDVKLVVDPIAIGGKGVGDEDAPCLAGLLVDAVAIGTVACRHLGKTHRGGQQDKQ